MTDDERGDRAADQLMRLVLPEGPPGGDQTVGLILNDISERAAGLGQGGPVLGPKNLARRLWNVSQDCRFSVIIPLSVLATCQAVASLPGWLHRTAFLQFVDRPDRISEMRQLWEAMAEDVPFLRGRVEPLFGWLETATAEDNEAAAACFRVISEIDFMGSVSRGAEGDILGAVANELLHRNVSAWPRWYWWTMTEARLAVSAYVDEFVEGSVWGDMECQVGSMAMAMNYEMRVHGLDPTKITWFLSDWNPTNVALTAVNVATFADFGENVFLHSRDDLLKLGKALPGNMKSAPRRPKMPKKPA